MTTNKTHVEQIILEILRQAGDEGLGRTKLYKVFWLAHLYYAAENRGFLSDWKIVCMPQGPGIHNGNVIIQDLVSRKRISQTIEHIGPFREYKCRFLGNKRTKKLSVKAVKAIENAIKFAKGKTAKEFSELSHNFSRSWRNASEGEELDIYTDLLSDEELHERKESLKQVAKEIEGIFKA